MSSKCPNRPNDNREEPRSTPRDLQRWRKGSKVMFQIRTRILVSKPDLTRDIIGSTQLIIITSTLHL